MDKEMGEKTFRNREQEREKKGGGGGGELDIGCKIILGTLMPQRY